MANQFLNVSWISDEVLRLLVNMLMVSEAFNKTYEKDFEKEFAVGSTIQVKFPQTFLVSDGMGYQPQGINRISTTVSLDQWLQVAWEWDDYEAAVKAERTEAEIREQYLDPAAKQIAQEIDSRSAQWAWWYTSNVVGALGTDPTTVSTYYAARRRLMELACPPAKQYLCISSSMMAALGSGITNIFNPTDEISQMFKDGSLGRLSGFEVYESQSLYSATTATIASTFTVTGAAQAGSALAVTGTAGDIIPKGTKITIANVNQVNPRTRRTAGPKTLKNFTVTQDYVLTSGPDTINILPAIYGPGSQYQNVDALPANGAAIVQWPGTASPNTGGISGTVGMVLAKNQGFALVGGRLYLPKSVEAKAQSSDKTSGLSLRWVKFWDPVRSIQGDRFDMLLGFGNLYQDNGACIVGGA